MIFPRVDSLSAELSIRLVLLGSGVGLVIGGLEYVVLADQFRDNGMFAWRVIKTRAAQSSVTPWESIKDTFYSARGTLALLWFRTLLLLGALFAVISGWFRSDTYFVLVLAILAITLLLNYRCVFGTDGSDQMLTVTLSGLAVYFGLALAHSQWKSVGLWFIALESCLAYEASGISKLWSTAWRSGGAAFKVLNTATYGSRSMAALLRRSLTLRKIACWSIIGYECLFPFCLFLPTRAAYSILILGIGFHVFNAIYMGLNVFLWAFVATYPAILFCRAQI